MNHTDALQAAAEHLVDAPLLDLREDAQRATIVVGMDVVRAYLEARAEGRRCFHEPCDVLHLITAEAMLRGFDG